MNRRHENYQNLANMNNFDFFCFLNEMVPIWISVQCTKLEWGLDIQTGQYKGLIAGKSFWYERKAFMWKFWHVYFAFWNWRQDYTSKNIIISYGLKETSYHNDVFEYANRSLTA